LLTAAWADAGHDVTLIATFSKHSASEIALADNVCFRRLAGELAFHPALARMWPWRVYRLGLTIRRDRPDVVCSFLSNVNIAAILAARWAGVPVVVSERAYPPAVPIGTIWKVLRRWLYPRADVVVMQATEGLNWLRREIPAANGTVIGNPVQLPLPPAPPLLDPQSTCRPGKRILLSMGRLNSQKRFDLLIEAFARIASRQPDWNLVILGEGELRQNLEDLIRRHGLVDRIVLPGRAGNPQAWFDRADAFALVSDYEGFPNALLESLVAGLPALATDCPTGPGELVEDGVNGVLLPAGSSADEVAAGLHRLLSSTWPDLNLRSVELRTKYSCQSIANAWLQLFEDLRGQQRVH